MYHIYPRSLQDSNGDGVGDLPGIIQRLDYIKGLGVNALWLSPFYPSPMADFGYDVADYCAVHPMFGTMQDFKELLQQAHERDIRVIIDLVPNHTSDEHEWFVQSRQSRTNPYADWYIWRNAIGYTGDTPLPPNNWRDALTGGPAWQWDDTRQQFYLHSFDVRQPDLNWSNPEVRTAVKEAMRYWLDLGVDGFRVDAVYWMAKDPLLSDDALNPHYVEGRDERYNALRHDKSQGWPFVYAYLSEMADVLKEPIYRGRQLFMVTEAYPDRSQPLVGYLNFYAAMDPAVAAPFNFEGLSLPWDARAWTVFLKSFHYSLQHFVPHGVASYAFGNHDKPRLASRLGPAAARSAAVMLLTLPGMVFVYYGEELGMEDVKIPRNMVQDPADKGGGGRDPQRTPMLWTAGKHAGFSTAGKTWLPVSPDYKTRNVEAQAQDPNSFLSLYRRLGLLRNASDALKRGRLHVIVVNAPDVLGYQRVGEDGDRYTTLINFSDQPVTCRPGVVRLGTLLVTSDPRSSLADQPGTETVSLRPNEAALFFDPAARRQQ